MKELIQQLSEYSEETGKEVYIELHDDGSGGLYEFHSCRQIFSFEHEDDFKNKLTF